MSDDVVERALRDLAYWGPNAKGHDVVLIRDLHAECVLLRAKLAEALEDSHNIDRIRREEWAKGFADALTSVESAAKDKTPEAWAALLADKPNALVGVRAEAIKEAAKIAEARGYYATGEAIRALAAKGEE